MQKELDSNSRLFISFLKHNAEIISFFKSISWQMNRLDILALEGSSAPSKRFIAQNIKLCKCMSGVFHKFLTFLHRLAQLINLKVLMRLQ
jgi:hypothetical protein